MINEGSSSYKVNLDLKHEISFRNALCYDYIRKFGTNPVVAVGAEEDIWDQGGTYVFPSDKGEEMYIASSNAGDTQIVDIIGLDLHGAVRRTFALLTGQTKVSVGVFNRVFRMYVNGTQANAGDIYVGNGTFTDGVPENIFAKIVVGAIQTRMALFTVPSNMRGSLTCWSASIKGTGNKNAELSLMYRKEGGSFVENDYFPLAQNTDTFLQKHLEPGDYLPPFTDILVRADSSSENLIIRAQFVILLKTLIDPKMPLTKGF